MKSYIRIYGPPILKAIRALEKIAVDMPEVCIWDVPMEATGSFEPLNIIDDATRAQEEYGYFYAAGIGDVPEQHCGKLISRSGEMLGDNDVYFEWFRDPSHDELVNLIEKIDNALGPLGCKYTITTK